MGPSLRAFISYRRDDAFMRSEQGAGPDFTFIMKLKAGLNQAGFADVFVDIDHESGLHAGDHYESRIHQAIADCDLFVALIGTRWFDILREKIAAGERDILVREIRAALKQEKEIVPLLVDGAAMPREKDLPETIRPFHYRNGLPIASPDPVETIAAALSDAAREVSRVDRFGSRWTWIYVILSCAAYYFCAVHTHIIGIMEYGFEPWFGMAKVWSGFYVWPMFFLPFALLALFRPLTILIETATNATRWRDVLTYTTPLVLGSLLAIGAVAIEVFGEYEVPWTIQPLLPQPGCERGPPTALHVLTVLSSYGKARDQGGAEAGNLRAQYGDRFWLKDKCWPNVFFYLTVPVYQHATDAVYKEERSDVQKAFVTVLKRDTGAPYFRYSNSVIPYVISFIILIWLASVGVIMSVFYVTVQIRRPHDDAVLRLPSEDAYLCLTYSFVTLMVWVPFRMNTIYIKNLYFCENLDNCLASLSHYLNDIVLAVTLLIGYVYLTVGLLIKYRRLVLGLLGTAAVILILSSAVAVIQFSEHIAKLTELWQFYVGFSIPMIVILLALWYQFDPAVVHFNDFKKDIE